MTFNGQPTRLLDWRVNVDRAGSGANKGGWRKQVACIDPSAAVTSNWRVPLKGIMSFELYSSAPQVGRCAIA